MDAAQDRFRTNYLSKKIAYANWHKQQSQQQILRSQLGFNDVTPSRPKVCQGCNNYHGIAYGHSRHTRSILVCAIHPRGWQLDDHCPDWCPASP